MPALVERNRQSRFIVTLTGGVRLIQFTLRFTAPTCPSRGTIWHPVEEGCGALRRYRFGLDVIAAIGELRFERQSTLGEIQTALPAAAASNALKEVQRLSAVFWRSC